EQQFWCSQAAPPPLPTAPAHSTLVIGLLPQCFGLRGPDACAPAPFPDRPLWRLPGLPPREQMPAAPSTAPLPGLPAAVMLRPAAQERRSAWYRTLSAASLPAPVPASLQRHAILPER